jgi:hypothetical protein
MKLPSKEHISIFLQLLTLFALVLLIFHVRQLKREESTRGFNFALPETRRTYNR